MRAFRTSASASPPSALSLSHSAISSSGMPRALAVFLPRFMSGMNRTFRPFSSAHVMTLPALAEVHTAPPRTPQKALSAADEFT